ncbi:prepilin peptidase [Candidatus Peregrinibacteria bacterium]|nr:prepilin peptidase [Candidatus Peregrinibacteria bacterium]
MIITFIGILGLFFGSFSNVVLYRLKNGGSICLGRSKCRDCDHYLSWLDLIPVFSWAFLKGKCRYCKQPISVQYPGVEIAFSLFWFISAYLTGVPTNSQEWGFLVFLLYIVSSLIIISVYDLLYYEIPDQVAFPAIAISIIAIFLGKEPSWKDAILGSVFIYSFFYIQILIPSLIYAFHSKKWKLIGETLLFYFFFPLWLFLSLFLPQKIIEKIPLFRESEEEEESPSWIGGGDLRLAFIMGLLLGLKKGILALFLSYIIGASISLMLIALKQKSRKSMVPFGPFLAAGTFISFFWGEFLWNAYWDFLI